MLAVPLENADCVRSRPAMLPKANKKRGRLSAAAAPPPPPPTPTPPTPPPPPVAAQSRSAAVVSGGPQQQQQRSRAWCGRLALLLVVSGLREGAGFRLVDENGTATPFVPYEQGFVGRYGDPLTTFVSDRVNEGAPGTPTYPRLYEGVYPRQICPGMVGPVDDGLYYCLGKEYGYCDRRSGTCFCNVGYQGISCQDCSSTHYSQGGLCYPKLVCPGDCSGAGTCHYSNGTCSCLDHRVGDDCSLPYCPSIFSDRCAECTSEACTSCESGYFVDEAGGGYECLSCGLHDPRCTRCNEESCLECTDLLLLSIRRSGARGSDPPLPFDELERELPHSLEFGTKDPHYFASAEAFDVVSNSSSPLNETSVACAQGVLGDDSWTCESRRISHRVCGNPGTLSFSSPEYQAFEDPLAAYADDQYDERYVTNGTVRITVWRTGGGYGTVGVRYRLQHGTTDEADVTPHAHYTTSNALVFAPGEVELSFLLSVHEDGEPENNEFFYLFLYDPWGGARLGAQQRTLVTVVDAQTNSSAIDHTLTTFYLGQGEGEAGDTHAIVAGAVDNVTIVTKDALGRERGFGGDVFAVWVEAKRQGMLDGEEEFEDASDGTYAGLPSAVAAMTRVQDLGSGNYTLSYQVDIAGTYFLRMALCRPGGLTGRYTSDSFFENEMLERVDRVMNFTWGSGAIAGTASNFAGVSWSGRIRPDYTETFEVELATVVGEGDAARLWIDGVVVVDGFERGLNGVDWEGADEGLGGGGRGYVNLTAGNLHEIYIEYSERKGDASLHLAWSSPSVSYQVVPPLNLFWVRELGGSPRALSVRSALTDGEKSETFGGGTVSAVAALPSTLTIQPRDAFGNLRIDETDTDVAESESGRFLVVLEAVDYDSGDTLGGVHGSAGSGGKVVTGTVELVLEEGVLVAEYVPFVAGTHLLNVTFQEWLFEPETHVTGSPFTVNVSPGEAFGRRSDAWGDALSNITAGAVANLTVRARDVVGNAIWEGGSELEVYAFHQEVEVYAAGTIDDLGNGTYVVSITPTVAGSYHIFVSLDHQEVADSPYSVVVPPSDAHGPTSSAYGLGVSAAVATLENTFYVQARDRWSNNIWGADFNVSAELFATTTSIDAAINASMGANETLTAVENNETPPESSPVTILGNGSGIALVTYVPREAGTSLLYVRVGGLQVLGSPFDVTVSAGPAQGANATVSGSALALATAGENSTFLIQARDLQANPAGEEGMFSSSYNDTGGAEGAGAVFNVTLTRNADVVGWEEEEEELDRDNSTVVHATLEYQGKGAYRAVYNATKAGNYSLEVIDVSDKEHAVGSPFEVLVEAAQAHAPATLVWWDRQVAGSSVVHLQAADFWNNNLSRGGSALAARWVMRSGESTLDEEGYGGAIPTNTAVGVQEGDFWVGGGSERVDTASVAAGYYFATFTADGQSKSAADSTPSAYDPGSSNRSSSRTSGNDGDGLINEGGSSNSSGIRTSGEIDDGYVNDGFVTVDDGNAYVTDVGGGRYEIAAAAKAGHYWLEIGVVEAGGLWGTFYEDGGVETEAIPLTQEADWRTKGNVDFNWGYLSPEPGVGPFSASSSSGNNSGENASYVHWWNSSSLFPADYFSARFTGFVKVEEDGEYAFRVTTDSSSKAALSVSGLELFNDIAAPSRPATAAAATLHAIDRYATDAVEVDGRGASPSPSITAVATASTAATAAAAAAAATVPETMPEGRTASVLLKAGQLIPLQLHYAHAAGDAWVRMEWSSRTDTRLSTVPATKLYHRRLGWKVAVNLNPAATASGASTVDWPSQSGRGGGGGGGRGSNTVREIVAGELMEIVVQARDTNGNHRGVGGDTIQAYGRGPGGVTFHGNAIDRGNGNYSVSAWPVVAGAYQMSILVSALERSRWALGYRSVEQAMAGAHVKGSPFRVLVVQGAVAANASFAYGAGIISSLAGGVLGTSVFTIRARDSMGNRVSPGSTGDFSVELFNHSASSQSEGDRDYTSPVSIGQAVYTREGEYTATYNVTTIGEYSLNVNLAGGGHIAGSPFALLVSPGPASAGSSVCENCQEAFSMGNSSLGSTKLLRLAARDTFGNAVERGGEEWHVSLKGDDEGVSGAGLRHPVVTDRGTGAYTMAVRPGAIGLYELQVRLLSRASTGDAGGGLSGSFGGGGLTAQYYSNARLAGRPLATRVDPSIRLDWGSGSLDDVSRLGSTGGPVGVRWDGFLKARLSEDFTFTMGTGPGDEARLWLGDDLVIDTSSSSSSNINEPPWLPDETVTGNNASSLTAGEIISLRAEYIHHGGGVGEGGGAKKAARVMLAWESAGTPQQIVPSFALYPGAEDIVGSPFRFSID